MRKMTWDEKLFFKGMSIIILVLALFWMLLAATFQGCPKTTDTQNTASETTINSELGGGE